MKHIGKLTFLHKTNGRYYDNHINNPKIEKLSRGYDSTSSCWIYSLLCENRDELQGYLAKNGIHSDVVHVRNDDYSVFKKFKCKLPGLDYFNSRLLNIPVGWWLSKKDLDFIVKIINNW
jgi:dTDP-4-amino-4,6-dideoxygalactose transaminase